MTKYKNILVPVDLSEQSHRAIEHAIAIAAERSCKIIVVHVISYLAPPHFESDLPQIYDHIEELTKQAKKKLSALIKPLAEQQNIHILIEVGKVAIKLIECINDNNVDLVIVGNHRSGALHGILGSVPSKLTNHAPCDVLVIQ